MNNFLDKLKLMTKNSDLTVALGVLLVLGVMIIPIPPLLLDLLLALTLAMSVVILLVSIYSKRPLDFSTFPSILLITTLFRLSLNVASTRNILLRGGSEGTSAAGEIIRTFGEFVVEGNYAVGIIIFIMAPLPKRKHSTARKGKRVAERMRESKLPQLVDCKSCGKKKLPHRICKYCGK